ncbi:MAG: DUF1570 domain-containing protein [Planctomycetales bacterium]|nr:DUF1570 domain-containing protein [Planctomycetales bacterium]
MDGHAMRFWKATAVVLALVSCTMETASADLIRYVVPGTDLAVVLRGRYTVQAGGNATFTHPKLGRLYMSAGDVEHQRLAEPSDEYEKMIRRAKTAEAFVEAADYALHNGMVDEVYEAATEAVALDPNNAEAKAILDLRDLIRSTDLGDSEAEEAHLRQTVKIGRMKIATSAHYILLHDTPDAFDRELGRTKPRAQERLELLEQVYESFLLKFHSKGVELEIPRQRLMVVLFNEEADYNRFATSLSPSLASAIGFYDPKSNIAFFYDHGSSDEFRLLSGIVDDLKAQGDRLGRANDPRARDAIRAAATIRLLIEIDRENSDIEVVSHECTHQMAGNTGLFPRDIMTPSWVHEGLATYFESPSEAAWSGIGAVNSERIPLYRILAENDPEHAHVSFIVSDEIFDLAGNHISRVHGYCQAWGLTHFMMERHFDELMTYYRRLGELPPDTPLSADLLTALFDDVFSSDRESLNIEFHSYMRGLRTETEDAFSDGLR